MMIFNVGAVLLSGLAVPGDSYLFRLRLKLGDELHYRTTIKAGDNPAISSDFRMKVVEVAGNCYIVKTTYSDFQPKGKAGNVNLVVWNTLTERGQSVRMIFGGQKGESQISMTTASGFAFPKEAVVVGQALPNATNSAASPSSVFTLKKVTIVKGRKVAFFDVRMDGDKQETPGGLRNVRSSLQLDVETGTSLAFEMSATTEGAGTTVPVKVSLVRLK